MSNYPKVNSYYPSKSHDEAKEQLFNCFPTATRVNVDPLPQVLAYSADKGPVIDWPTFTEDTRPSVLGGSPSGQLIARSYEIEDDSFDADAELEDYPIYSNGRFGGSKGGKSLLERAGEIAKDHVLPGAVILAKWLCSKEGAMAISTIATLVSVGAKLAGATIFVMPSFSFPSLPDVAGPFSGVFCGSKGLMTRGTLDILSIPLLYPGKTRVPAALWLAFSGVYRVGSAVIDRCASPIGATWATRYISKSLGQNELSSSQQRQVFVDSPLVKSKPTQNHTHGSSAADRNCGGTTAALVARQLGYEPYFIQQSLADIRKDRAGDRSFHWAKDIAIPPSGFTFDCKTQAAVLVDVDFYIDMPKLLARHPGTYFVATFQPTSTGCNTGEYSFRFMANGKVQYRVSGGAEYEHEVWDYSGDTFLVSDSWCLNKRVSAYHIDRKYVDDHHCIVMLSLIGTFDTWSLLPTSWFLSGKTLGRLNPVNGDFAVLDCMSKDGLRRSVSVLESTTSVVLPIAQFDAVKAVALVAKVPITPAMVASNIAASDPLGLPTAKLAPGHAAIIANYTRSQTGVFPPVVYPPSAGYVPISFDKNDYTAPIPLSPFGSPLIGPCYGFVSSLATDNQCIKGRVEQYKRVDNPPLPPTLAGYMVEFAEFLIPQPNIGTPVGHDEVLDRQDRPTQRALIAEASVTGQFVKWFWNCFVKKETYTKPTDPRNISAAIPSIKLEYSTFVYAFHDHVMSNQSWYAFAMTPVEIANRVCAILADAPHGVEGDGNRLDGHVSRFARVLERVCMFRYFAREFFSRLNEVMDAQIAVPGVTEFGRKYTSGFGRGSGSLETSDFNTILVAFIDYCAWRNTLVNGRKLSASEAWGKLGIYGGDDSLTGAVDPEALRRSAELMGQDYTIGVKIRGQMGVSFLNRQFGPDVWTGCPNSMANPSRLLSKFWVGPTHLKNVLERFAERCSGYYRMDKNSPAVGRICIVAHKLLGDRTGGVLAPWDGQHGKWTNWPNEDSGWMEDNFNKQIPDFDWDRFNEWIDYAEWTCRPDLLLQAPLCTSADGFAPEVKVTCIVGDDLCHPPARPLPEAPLPEWDEEDDKNCSSAEIIEADAAVPKVGADGLQVDAVFTTVARREKRRREKQEVSEPKDFKDPNTWLPPKNASFEKMAQWHEKRDRVAKRHGIVLKNLSKVDACFAKLNGNNGSATNTDDHAEYEFTEIRLILELYPLTWFEVELFSQETDYDQNDFPIEDNGWWRGNLLAFVSVYRSEQLAHNRAMHTLNGNFRMGFIAWAIADSILSNPWVWAVAYCIVLLNFSLWFQFVAVLEAEHEARNREMHALNGNIHCGLCWRCKSLDPAHGCVKEGWLTCRHRTSSIAGRRDFEFQHLTLSPYTDYQTANCLSKMAPPQKRNRNGRARNNMASQMRSLTNEIAQLKVSKKTGQARPSRNRRARGGQGGPQRMVFQEAPAAVSAMQQNRGAMVNRRNGATTVRHREQVATLVGQTGNPANFGGFQLKLNPGDTTTFPYLSEIAAAYDEYRFTALRAEFVTRTSTAQIGRVVISPDYNPKDPQPSTLRAAENMKDSADGAVWQNPVSVLNVSRMHPNGRKKYIRHGPLVTNIDIEDYDVGTVSCLTDFNSSNTPLGELYLEYTVELTAEAVTSGLVLNDGPVAYNNAQSSNFSTLITGNQDVSSATPVALGFGNSVALPMNVDFGNGGPNIQPTVGGPCLITLAFDVTNNSLINSTGGFLQIKDNSTGGVVNKCYFTVTNNAALLEITSFQKTTYYMVGPTSSFELSGALISSLLATASITNISCSVQYIN